MKHIKKLNEYFNILNTKPFKNEVELKTLLMKDKDFAEGEVFQGLLNVIHSFWDDKMSYDNIIDFVKNKFGNIPLFALFLGKYNYQVENGGHMQYYDNGYASANSRGFGRTYENIDIHEDFVELFKALAMDEILTNGSEALDIIKDFDLDLENEIETCSYCNGSGQENCYTCNGNGVIDCTECGGDGEIDGEECSNCGGDGVTPCEECDGNGTHNCDECDGSGEYDTGNTVPSNKEDWERLDNRWYEINEDLIKSFDGYLQSLTLDGERIADLVKLAKPTQQYNL